MLQQQINRSTDLKQLRDEGFEIEIHGGHLIAHHVPYVNSNREIKLGKLISTLCLNNDVTIKPDNHVIYFMGDYPCDKEGAAITAIQHQTPNRKLSDDILLNYSFSNKPPEGYRNYYEKINQYIKIISAPALALDPTVTAKTFRVIEDKANETVFKYIDTNTSRANINQINSKLNGQKIGIIGLGGTGSYILDLVAKTPVSEILLFDGDEFLQHNAFRSPGAPSVDVLNMQKKKVDYYASIYSEMHKGINPIPDYVTAENVNLLIGLSHIFLCIDNGKARGMIISKLNEFGISFTDVGLGVNIVDNNLIGTIRATTVTAAKNDHIVNRIDMDDIDDNEYATNIQIADLNVLNAVLAVIKWKKLSGFYQDLKQEYHTTYTINTGQLLNEDVTT